MLPLPNCCHNCQRLTHFAINFLFITKCLRHKLKFSHDFASFWSWVKHKHLAIVLSQLCPQVDYWAGCSVWVNLPLIHWDFVPILWRRLPTLHENSCGCLWSSAILVLAESTPSVASSIPSNTSGTADREHRSSVITVITTSAAFSHCCTSTAHGSIAYKAPFPSLSSTALQVRHFMLFLECQNETAGSILWRFTGLRLYKYLRAPRYAKYKRLRQETAPTHSKTAPLSQHIL
jgi:hypothetical protein